ncbi:MAG TPA: chemotaxis protein CheW [Nitrospira sp.]|nr:chemotaxis protein CheW [Nitrospira sp.]
MSLRGHIKPVTHAVRPASFLIVRYGTRYCALPSEGVRGVLTREEAGGGPNVVWVGRAYPDVDLAGLLSTTVDDKSSDLRIVLFSHGRSHGAIRVDEVIGLAEVDRNECHPLPPHFRGDERSWVLGTASVGNKHVLILNPEWVLGELGEVVAMVSRRSIG